MCFGYLLITNQTGSQALQYKKSRRLVKNEQETFHQLFHIPKNSPYTLGQLNDGYFNSLMDAISIEDQFLDSNVVQYV